MTKPDERSSMLRLVLIAISASSRRNRILATHRLHLLLHYVGYMTEHWVVRQDLDQDFERVPDLYVLLAVQARDDRLRPNTEVSYGASTEIQTA